LPDPNHQSQTVLLERLLSLSPVLLQHLEITTMAFNQAMMDDLVVIPTISLNPKKAKKKLKKAARMSDDTEITQLPVYQETQRPAAAKSSSKNSSQVRSPLAPKPVEEPAFFKPAPALLASTCNTKRSWFDITEEDEDDFIGLSFTSSIIA
jgi:hypothetical protein